MGLRDRLKTLLASALGGDEAAPNTGPKPYRSPVYGLVQEARARREEARAAEARAAEARADEARAAEQRAAEAARKAPAKAPAPAESAPRAPEADPVAADKQKAFMDRAKRGLLKKVADEGGRMGLGELHDFSERKFFIAHRGFSNVMEEFVAEGVVDFNSNDNIVELTKAGRARIEG